MSVLSCSRMGCENIMCDRLSSRYGYICNECFEELKNSKAEINYFMHTEKNTFYKDNAYEQICENEFKLVE